jgi:hypothetical protein
MTAAALAGLFFAATPIDAQGLLFLFDARTRVPWARGRDPRRIPGSQASLGTSNWTAAGGSTSRPVRW